MMKTMQEIEQESKAQIVATVEGQKVTRGELMIAFNAVANKENWKMPIDKVIDLHPYTMAMVREAVIFFTGSVPTFTALTGTTTSNMGRYRVKAKGYYATVGA